MDHIFNISTNELALRPSVNRFTTAQQDWWETGVAELGIQSALEETKSARKGKADSDLLGAARLKRVQ